MTLEEVAAYFHCSKRTVYRWLADGKLKGAKAGRRWLFDFDEVHKLLKTAND